MDLRDYDKPEKLWLFVKVRISGNIYKKLNLLN